MGTEHPLVEAVIPLLERIGAELVPVAQRRAGDVPLVWDGVEVAAVRLPGPDLTTALERLILEIEGELGGSLDSLDRPAKQRAVRMLEERGAFTLRGAVEGVAAALGVTRFTVYNYLNRDTG
ncbi:transcriptional regulator [Amycolatopsis antarctica]|uniref:Transcriptional regulator n=1 Tax=Amycolatopsis antarctica TaxID=1854586 RepID=A0A263D9R5_9PSEU|nr:helix-turn-helix domain-containing protein [Amycolatopsis antarctica]OZM74115.1 transcriptional regulator [Amycolatopsis antarctica]